MAAEAMAVLWEKMAAGEQVEFVLPFLFSVIRNKALHYLRRESLKYQIHGSIGSDASREIQFRINTLEACDPHALYAEDVQTILHKSLDALGRQTRRVFMLSRFEGMSNRQIAQEFGISEKSVEYRPQSGSESSLLTYMCNRVIKLLFSSFLIPFGININCF